MATKKGGSFRVGDRIGRLAMLLSVAMNLVLLFRLHKGGIFADEAPLQRRPRSSLFGPAPSKWKRSVARGRRCAPHHPVPLPRTPLSTSTSETRRNDLSRDPCSGDPTVFESFGSRRGRRGRS
uniref:Uncharacterized protein n=1 Tax=Ananas comosus var. bracteatus TaxID=296719 RepID=A0A6V7QIH7_ANACO|nr:unnamed protein product [Ananas comosus var. bracteatus]